METTGPRKGVLILEVSLIRRLHYSITNNSGPQTLVLISEVSLIRRLHYGIANNSGPRTLVLISEVSAIGGDGVRFRRFHSNHKIIKF